MLELFRLVWCSVLDNLLNKNLLTINKISIGYYSIDGPGYLIEYFYQIHSVGYFMNHSVGLIDLKSMEYDKYQTHLNRPVIIIV